MLIYNSTWEADKGINIPLSQKIKSQKIKSIKIPKIVDSGQVLPCLPTAGPGVHGSVVLQGQELSTWILSNLCRPLWEEELFPSSQKGPSLSAVTLGWFWIMLDTQTALETAWLLLSMEQPLCHIYQGNKPTKCLMKCTEIISQHVQDAQEGGGTPPTDPGTEGKNPAELSSEMQDAASLAALKFLIFWLFLAWSWEAPCSNRLWKHSDLKQTDPTFFLLFLPLLIAKKLSWENAGWPGSIRKDTRSEICQHYSLLSKFIFFNSSNTPLFPLVSGKHLVSVFNQLQCANG